MNDKMLIKYAKNKISYATNDGCNIYEILHPESDNVQTPYSFAFAKVKPHSRPKNHSLTHTEIYYIIEGVGFVTIGYESAEVVKGDLVFIPPLINQLISNEGSQTLKFLAIVSPP
ncbi:MAG: cupin domain-containing protein [Pseudomonadota bacterium]|nr:cupin domain-containing protein [Pseudomonadota bacterium]